jgi:hypothetical protein
MSDMSSTKFILTSPLKPFVGFKNEKIPLKPYVTLFGGVHITPTHVEALQFFVHQPVRSGAKLIFMDHDRTIRVIARMPSIAFNPGEIILNAIAFERVEFDNNGE